MFDHPNVVNEANVRDTLFGDAPIAPWANVETDIEPWSRFKEAKTRMERGESTLAISILRKITETPGLESRHYLEAFHFLRTLGITAPPERVKEVLGVVVEVGTRNGLDLVAAYADHHARYLNFSGAAVAWERPSMLLDEKIDALLNRAAPVVRAIGLWDKKRPDAPPTGQMRINFLTPSGLHFGQGEINAISKDPLVGPVVSAAFQLMQSLIALAKKK
jgi:hypothetical protein